MITMLKFRVRGTWEENADGTLLRVDIAHVLPPVGDETPRLGVTLSLSGVPVDQVPPLGATLYAPLLDEEPES